MNLTKQQLIELSGKQDQIDVAIPVDTAMYLREIGINPSHYAMDYSENKISGKLISLIEIENAELKRILKDVLEANIDFIRKIEILELDIRKQEIHPHSR